MKRKKYSPEQIVVKLRQGEAERAQGATIEAVCRKLEVSTQTYLRWRQMYSGMRLDQVRQLRTLERENGRLKKLVAEQALDIVALKEIARPNW